VVYGSLLGQPRKAGVEGSNPPVGLALGSGIRGVAGFRFFRCGPDEVGPELDPEIGGDFPERLAVMVGRAQGDRRTPAREYTLGLITFDRIQLPGPAAAALLGMDQLDLIPAPV
jgi:hypothetical protein